MLTGDAVSGRTIDDAKAWSEQAADDVDVNVFSGGRVSLNEHEAEIQRGIRRRLGM